MRKSQAVLVMNMLASEFGYSIEWVLLPDGKTAELIRFVNGEGDIHEFSGTQKIEEAVHWLRKQA